MKPYTYLIGWSKENKFYYGVRYAKNSHPNDLWNPYKTSSPIVKKFVAEHGDPDIREIRKIFTTPKEAETWETKVLRRCKVLDKNHWLNGNIAGSIKTTPEMYLENAKKQSETKKANGVVAWNKGLTKETSVSVLKYAKAAKRPKSEKHKEAMRKPKSDSSKMGRYERSAETKEKLRKAAIEQHAKKKLLVLNNSF